MVSNVWAGNGHAWGIVSLRLTGRLPLEGVESSDATPAYKIELEMDPLTHSTFGMAVAMMVAPVGFRRQAALAGLAAGLLPDADIFIRSDADPLLGVEYHRHFTHSVVFQPVVALLAASIAWLLLLGRTPWRALFLPALAAGLSHIFCDAWTSYGTRLWWPFADTRVAWDMVSIIDPFVTLPLLAGVISAFWRPRSRALPIALGFLGLYLGLSLVQQKRAMATLVEVAEKRGHTIERVTVKPSFANIIVWRGLYQTDGRYHSVAIRPGLTETVVVDGDSLPVFDVDAAQARLGKDTRLARDLGRFAHFSDQWVAEVAAPDGETRVLGDVRYSMLPQKMSPLWGIGMNPSAADQSAPWMNLRVISGHDRSGLWQLVKGDSPPKAPEI
jgi:inner membrane protein